MGAGGLQGKGKKDVALTWHYSPLPRSAGPGVIRGSTGHWFFYTGPNFMPAIGRAGNMPPTVRLFFWKVKHFCRPVQMRGRENGKNPRDKCEVRKRVRMDPFCRDQARIGLSKRFRI